MDKMYNISLGGYGFSIEDKAYQLLQQYLNDISVALRTTNGAQEILNDVEYRMAELLKRRLNVREVVNTIDIEYLIQTMGKASAYASDEADQEHSRTYQSNSRFKKTLYRDPENKMIGGVLSGIAHYFGINVTYLRIAIALLPFLDVLFLGISTSSIILVYIILWMVVPEAKTTSENLQMQGKPVNLDSIKAFVKEQTPHVKNTAENITRTTGQLAKDSRNTVEDVLKIILKVIAAIFLIGALLIAIVLLVALFAVAIGLGAFGVSFNDYLPFIFDSPWQSIIAYSSMAIILIVPTIVLVLLLLRLISSRFKTSRGVYYTLLSLFILASIGIIFTTVNSVMMIKSEVVLQKNQPIEIVDNQLNIIGVEDHHKTSDNIFVQTSENMLVDENRLWFGQSLNLNLKQSSSKNAYVETEIESHGKNPKDAEYNAEQVGYEINIEDNNIYIHDFAFLQNGAKFRGQEIEHTLYIPEALPFTIKNFNRIYTEDFGSFARFRYNENESYVFKDFKIVCLNCIDESTEAVDEVQKINTDSIQ